MADNNSRTLTANFTADTSGFSPKINDLVQKLKSASQEFEQNKTKIAALKTEMKTYQRELAKLENINGPPTAAQAREIQQLRERIAACSTQLGTYSSAQRQLTADMNSMNRQLSEARDEFSGTGQAAATFGEVLKANIASEVILGAIRKLVDGLRQAAAYCYSTGSAFEAGMSKVAAVSGASADDLERLTEKAKDLGASTKFTATETAEAMNYMAMAGWKTEQMLEGIDGVLGLAAASGTDLATTSDIVTDALTAFGMKAEDCAHFADVLAAASSNANTNVSMMGETFKYCAPIAGALGFKAEDVAVGIGLMANAGVKATNAGTAMRKFMTELSEGLTITGEKFGEVTISTSNADGSMRSYAEILKELRGVFAQLTDSEKSAAAKDIVGQNALSGFLAMMNASEADVNKLTAAIQNCDGAAANMAETMEQNVSGAVTKMNSALEGVGIAVYDKFKGGLLDAVNIFTETLGELKTDIDGGELDDSIGNLAESFKHLATEAATFIKNTLPGFINGFANVLNFFVKFRSEITGVISSVVAFKTSMKLGTFISDLVSSFKKLTAATQGAEAAQAGLNATVAAGHPLVTAISAGVAVLGFGLGELVSRLNRSSESAEELREKCESLAQKTAEYKQKCDDLSDIKKQYEEIADSLDPDVDKTQALKDMQDQLIAQFPELADQIDLVNGSYDEMADKLQSVIDKTSESYKIAAKGSLNAKKKEERTIITTFDEEDLKGALKDSLLNGYGGTEINDLFNKYMTVKPGEIGFDGNYEERLEKMSALYNEIKALNNGEYEQDAFMIALAEKIAEVQRLSDELKAAQVEVDNLNNKMNDTDSDDTSSYGGTWRNKEEADKAQRRQAEKKAEEDRKKEELKAAKEKYDEEKQLADDRYSVGEMSEADYYARLTELRDEYLEAQSHDWYVATAKIKSYQKSSLSETERAYKETLAAIDAEIERHKRAKSDREYEEKLAAIDDQIMYGRLDEFEKYELEKERKRLQEEREEEMFSRSTDDVKSAAKSTYDAQKALEKANESTKEYTMAIGDYTDALENLSGTLKGVSESFTVNGGASSVTNFDESTKNQYVNVVLQAVNRSNDQLVNQLIKALTSKL